MRIPPDRRFELLYALAYAGVFIGFIPFFSLFLPIKVQLIAPQDKVSILTLTAISGVAVASVSNIAFGWLSDRTYVRRGTRRPWVVAGLAALLAAYGAVHVSSSASELVAAVLFFQVALNMLFAPLLAVMADTIPNRRKGTVAGMMGIAHPMASLTGVLVTLSIFSSEAERYGITCVLTAAAIMPFLLFAGAGGDAAADDGPLPPDRQLERRDLVLAWLARLFIQAAGTAVMTYSFFYFQEALQREGVFDLYVQTRYIARTIAVSTMLAVLVTLASGWFSDRIGRRKPFLVAYAGLTVAGLAGMAGAASWTASAASYIFFVIAYSAFIALLMAFTMQILPSPRHRGRDLGFFNLTNTIPEAVGTALAFPFLAGASSFSPMLTVVALLAAIGGGFVLLIREREAAWVRQPVAAE